MKLLPRKHHYIYFLTTIIFIFLWGYRYQPCHVKEYLWPLVGLTLILLVVEIIFLAWTSHSIVRDLNNGNIQRFLQRTDKEINESPKGAWQNGYKVNKTAGLYCLGRFEEALALLETVNPKKLQKTYRYLYVNNRIANLLGLERIREIEALLEEYPDYSKAGSLHKNFYAPVQANLGKLKYHQGEYETARYLLEDALTHSQSPISRGIVHYCLGLVDLKEGKTEASQKHFNEAKHLAPQTYVIERMDKLEKGKDSSGE